MKELLIGTNNPSKLRRMTELLDGTGVICRSPAELGLVCDAPETASDAAGNALEKALAWHRLCGLPVYAEDSGLVFLDLPRDHPDQPGVHVRRYQGVSMDDVTMRDHYRALAHKHGGALRSAWQSAHCMLASPDDYALLVDDEPRLLKHAFLLTDRIHGDITPGWPLECLKSQHHTVVSDEDRTAYWADVQSWLQQWVLAH